MMQKKLAALALLFAIPLAAGAETREGLYEVTVKTAMPMMPADSMPPQVVRQCFAQTDLQSPKHMMAHDDPTCQIKDQVMGGNRMAFTIDCPSQGMSGKAEYNFSDTGFTGSVAMTMPDPQGGPKPMTMTMTTTTTAKLLGPCK